MRKLLWVFMVIAGLSTFGNLIGGTDTPVTASTRPDRTATQPSAIPVPPTFTGTMYVAADTLNLREAPTTSARVLARLPRNLAVASGERRDGWVLVSAAGRTGWVSGTYPGAAPIASASRCHRRASAVRRRRSGAPRPAPRAGIAGRSDHVTRRGSPSPTVRGGRCSMATRTACRVRRFVGSAGVGSGEAWRLWTCHPSAGD